MSENKGIPFPVDLAASIVSSFPDQDKANFCLALLAGCINFGAFKKLKEIMADGSREWKNKKRILQVVDFILENQENLDISINDNSSDELLSKVVQSEN